MPINKLYCLVRGTYMQRTCQELLHGSWVARSGVEYVTSEFQVRHTNRCPTINVKCMPRRWRSIGWVLISLSVTVEAVSGYITDCRHMASVTPDLQLPSHLTLILIAPTHRGMARLSWVWSPIPVLTRLDVDLWSNFADRDHCATAMSKHHHRGTLLFDSHIEKVIFFLLVGTRAVSFLQLPTLYDVGSWRN